MVHGKKRIPYWIDWRLPGLAGPEYHAVISFGLPIEPEDSQYGEYRLRSLIAFLGSTSSVHSVKQKAIGSVLAPSLLSINPGLRE